MAPDLLIIEDNHIMEQRPQATMTKMKEEVQLLLSQKHRYAITRFQNFNNLRKTTKFNINDNIEYD